MIGCTSMAAEVNIAISGRLTLSSALGLNASAIDAGVKQHNRE